MDKQHIVHISDAFYRRLKKYSNNTTKNFNTESIHKFRVEYKKLRAFFRMLSQAKGTAQKIKIPKPLKQAYAIAGRLRDLQLQQQLLTKTSGKKGAAFLQNKIDTTKTALLKAISKNPVSISKKKTSILLPDKYPLRCFKIFIQTKQSSANGIVSKKQLADAGFHAIRKIIKDLFYNLQLYKGDEYKKLSRLIYKEKNEKYFKQLLNELGRLQDKCVAIALLKISGTTPQAGIRKQWVKEKNTLKQLLTKKLKTFVPR